MISDFRATPYPLLRGGKQYVVLSCQSEFTGHCLLDMEREGETMISNMDLGICHGQYEKLLMIQVPKTNCQALFTLKSLDGKPLAECNVNWTVPRHWTLDVVVGSHTDIGLHNSPYIQRHNSVKFLELATQLCDETENLPPESRYRYMMEGTWFWENYEKERGRQEAERVASNYLNTGKIAIGCCTAGNHTQVYGFEEMCRSAYTRERLNRDWNVSSSTMTMIDNNGMSWALVVPYCSAGIKNILFAPNQWNPLPSTIWPRDKSIPSYIWNPDAGGGGARVDVRYDSPLPMVFWWEGADARSRILVWCSTQYVSGGMAFGLSPTMAADGNTIEAVERKMSRQLAKLENRYPFDRWLIANYQDDQKPGLEFANFIKAWNNKWDWPKIRMVGNLDEPFEYVKRHFGKDIPVLRGDMTSGWSQHPLTTPELLAQKFTVDRRLPEAEMASVLASLMVDGYTYPAIDFERAWDGLICNDEHSYGTSGYQGRRVYETWMQHRDWIDKAQEVANNEQKLALTTLLNKRVNVPQDGVFLFNPTLSPRQEVVALDGKKFLSPKVPSFGYAVVTANSLECCQDDFTPLPQPPVVENDFFIVSFAENGSLARIYDKSLQRDLLSACANEFTYTRDNHATFHRPQKATFEISQNNLETIVRCNMDEPISQAAIETTYVFPNNKKRIDITNKLQHVRDLINAKRYYRYGYFAFPFQVENARFYAQLNGCVATPGIDQTGHGTDTYLAAREWCCVEGNHYGVGLIQLDSHLVEFGKIHPDKTDYGSPETGTGIYSYLFNDWLQMHTAGGDHVNPIFRYSILPYQGTWQDANLPMLADQAAHPMTVMPAEKHPGDLPESKSFLSVNASNLQLMALKRAEDGDGLVLRLRETCGRPVEDLELKCELGQDFTMSLCTVDERPENNQVPPRCDANGIVTFRLRGTNLPERAIQAPVSKDGRPLPIGSNYTGLITKPCAARGENRGHLYLLWGASTEPDFSHYELYRSTKPGFVPDKDTFIANVQNEEFCVGRYEDTGLDDHRTYYYRVRAVNNKGQAGDFSEEFSGVTFQPPANAEC